MGAYHPTDFSNTKHFHAKGWHGINIEPGPSFSHFLTERPNDVNLNVAASDRPGTAALHNATAPGTATLAAEGAAHAADAPLTVPAMTLAEIFTQHAPAGDIHFMSVDVEGHEKEALAGNDWSRFRPMVLVVEATEPDTPAPSHDSWEPLLLESDYLLAFFDGLNRFYVRKESRELLDRFNAPANVFDHYIPREVHDLRQRLEETNAHIAAMSAELVQLREMTRGVGHRALKLARVMSKVYRKVTRKGRP